VLHKVVNFRDMLIGQHL